MKNLRVYGVSHLHAKRGRWYHTLCSLYTHTLYSPSLYLLTLFTLSLATHTLYSVSLSTHSLYSLTLGS